MSLNKEFEFIISDRRTEKEKKRRDTLINVAVRAGLELDSCYHHKGLDDRLRCGSVFAA